MNFCKIKFKNEDKEAKWLHEAWNIQNIPHAPVTILSHLNWGQSLFSAVTQRYAYLSLHRGERESRILLSWECLRASKNSGLQSSKLSALDQWYTTIFI